MKKGNKELFEQVTFDDVAYARDVVASADDKLEKCKRGLIVGLVASLGWLIMALIPQVSAFLACLGMLIGVVGTIAAYVLGGGLGKAFSTGFKLAKIGWFIIPIFPVDIFVGITAFCIVGWFFIFVPSLFVFVNMRQISKEKDAAEEFLGYCR